MPFWSRYVTAGNDLLVGRRGDVEDVLGRLQALVLDRVVQQAVQLLDDRQDRFATGRGPAAEDRGDLFVLDQQLGLFGERRPVGRAVLDDGHQLLAHDAAGSC